MSLGVTFNDFADGTYHTADDWGLMWESYKVSAPEPITHYVQIPGAKTLLDLTESVYGKIRYKPRTFEARFHAICFPSAAEVLLRQIYDAIEGKRVRIRTDVEPDRYMIGRPVVKMQMIAANVAEFDFTAQVEPYKYGDRVPVADWLWDPFCFEDGYISDPNFYEVSGSQTVTVEGPQYPARLQVHCSAEDCTLTYSGKTYDLEQGPNDLNIIVRGTNTYTLSGTGNYTISFVAEEL